MKEMLDLCDRPLKFGDIVAVGWSGGGMTINLFLGYSTSTYKDKEGNIIHWIGNPEFIGLDEYMITSIKKNGRIYPERIQAYRKQRLVIVSKESLPETQQIIYNKLLNLIKNGNTRDRN